MKDATETMRADAPHRRAAIEAREKATRLMREVEDPNIRLSPEQRAERRQQIASLQEDARREQEAVLGLTDELRTHLPAWIKDHEIAAACIAAETASSREAWSQESAATERP
jgi:hypothetical protein